MTKSARPSSLPASLRQVIFRIFSCVLLKGNYTTFLVQFGFYLHSWVFQKAQIAESLTRANKFQIELEVV